MALWSQFAVPTALAEPFVNEVRPLLSQYCFECHGNEVRKGGINLQQTESPEQMLATLQNWETTIRVVRDHAMPPMRKDQPTQPEWDQIASILRRTLNGLDYPLDPGPSIVRRLTRREYNNTIRDLFDLHIAPADDFPADGGGGEGFDNNATTLYLPPILLERYLAAARKIVAAIPAEKLRLDNAEASNAPAAHAEEVMKQYLPRIFRRPARDGEVARYLTLFERLREQQGDTDAALRTTLAAMLTSPHFLFRVESLQEGNVASHRVSDYELATRLSYFLWASMPDQELFDLAEAGTLHEPEVIAQQVKRMLADPKSQSFAEAFASQWLDVERIHSAQPNRGRSGPFEPELRQAMLDEATSFVHYIFQNDRPLTELLDADYVFVNESLATHYGLSGVSGAQMQRVEAGDSGRGGILTLGAVMTISSYPARTSPVLRGKWVLERVLGSPAPPPPDNVKTLPPSDAPEEGLTFRQRLEQHRADARCASCHDRLDPLGFALENFDLVGRWRGEIGGTAIDTAGQLPTGETFNGPVELKQVLLKHKEDFLRNLTHKLLGYALGRGVESFDAPVVRDAMAALEANDFSSHTLILQVVGSYPFTHRRGDANAVIESLFPPASEQP